MNKKRPKAIERLIETAVEAQKRAYCPYSRYPVGAAVLTESGRVFAGCNVENASYGLSMCAERVAVYHALTSGHDSLRAVCVVGAAAKPCGACRQVLIEFADKDTQIFLVDLNPASGRRTVNKTTVFKLLPMAFDPLASGLLPQNPRNLLKRKSSHRGRRKGARPPEEMMDTQPLRAVLDWMKGTDLVEVAYKKDGQGFAVAAEGAPPAIPGGSLPPSRFVPVAAESVGVFQWSEPGKPRVAEEGAAVAEGAVLAVIVAGSGALKPVKAPCAGRVSKCFAEAGQGVEYGRPLFLLEPGA